MSNTEMITFLRNLANDIEKDRLNNSQLQKIGEFLMSYTFEQRVDSNTDEFMKFITLGWYVYKVILKEE